MDNFEKSLDTTTISKLALFSKLGFGAEHYEGLNQLLNQHNLTNLLKSNISRTKIEKINKVLKSEIVRYCHRGDCKQAALKNNHVQTIQVGRVLSCDICGGSVVRSKCELFIEFTRKNNIQNLCVVGGFPKPLNDFKNNIGKALKLKIIDGSKSRRKKQCKEDLSWADLVIIWGKTPVGHSLSSTYMSYQHSSFVQSPTVVGLFDHFIKH